MPCITELLDYIKNILDNPDYSRWEKEGEIEKQFDYFFGRIAHDLRNKATRRAAALCLQDTLYQDFIRDYESIGQYYRSLQQNEEFHRKAKEIVQRNNNKHKLD